MKSGGREGERGAWGGGGGGGQKSEEEKKNEEDLSVLDSDVSLIGAWNRNSD